MVCTAKDCTIRSARGRQSALPRDQPAACGPAKAILRNAENGLAGSTEISRIVSACTVPTWSPSYCGSRPAFPFDATSYGRGPRYPKGASVVASSKGCTSAKHAAVAWAVAGTGLRKEQRARQAQG